MRSEYALNLDMLELMHSMMPDGMVFLMKDDPNEWEIWDRERRIVLGSGTSPIARPLNQMRDCFPNLIAIAKAATLVVEQPTHETVAFLKVALDTPIVVELPDPGDGMSKIESLDFEQLEKDVHDLALAVSRMTKVVEDIQRDFVKVLEIVERKI